MAPAQVVDDVDGKLRKRAQRAPVLTSLPVDMVQEEDEDQEQRLINEGKHQFLLPILFVS